MMLTILLTMRCSVHLAHQPRIGNLHDIQRQRQRCNVCRQAINDCSRLYNCRSHLVVKVRKHRLIVECAPL